MIRQIFEILFQPAPPLLRLVRRLEIPLPIIAQLLAEPTTIARVFLPAKQQLDFFDALHSIFGG